MNEQKRKNAFVDRTLSDPGGALSIGPVRRFRHATQTSFDLVLEARA